LEPQAASSGFETSLEGTEDFSDIGRKI